MEAALRPAEYLNVDTVVRGCGAPAPDGVDVALRSGAGKRILILTNYAATPKTIPLPAAMCDVLSGGTISTVTLPQYGVAVLRFP